MQQPACMRFVSQCFVWVVVPSDSLLVLLVLLCYI